MTKTVIIRLLLLDTLFLFALATDLAGSHHSVYYEVEYTV